MKIFKKSITWFLISLVFCLICTVLGFIGGKQTDHHEWEIITNFQIGSLIAQVICVIIGCIVGNRYEK